MPRRLSLEEAETVSSSAREDGDRPTLFRAASGSEEEISQDFETYLILTDIGTRSRIANFFQVILENDPNDLELYTSLLREFLEEEVSNATGGRTSFDEVTELYDDIRQAYGVTTDGFTDVSEVNFLQEALTNSLGSIAEQRDRFSFNFAALSVLQARQEAGSNQLFRQELESWVRVLVEYE